jgi:uncharacterized FlgJ-related protein
VSDGDRKFGGGPRARSRRRRGTILGASVKKLVTNEPAEIGWQAADEGDIGTGRFARRHNDYIG